MTSDKINGKTVAELRADWSGRIPKDDPLWAFLDAIEARDKRIAELESENAQLAVQYNMATGEMP